MTMFKKLFRVFAVGAFGMTMAGATCQQNWDKVRPVVCPECECPDCYLDDDDIDDVLDDLFDDDE